ncbi:flavin reductase family protein [Lactococcus ileimucosae]|uniref:Flavin reductase family protein n=1 Tax=Lactococcus ileimucosae TaxID=2941329 RepID=A0ABV4D0E1_9LACT|nr:flavin reductase family protein [Lactococcus ileimucosae]
MKAFKTKDMNSKEAYKLISGLVVPRPIAWLTTQNSQGVVNAAPFSFFNVVSKEPVIVSIAMTEMKDSVRNLLEREEGVIHLVNTENVEAMNQTSAPLAANESEVEKFGISLTASQEVEVPAIANAKARLEVTLYKHIPVGKTSHLMLLEVKNILMDDAVIDEDKLYIKAEALDPVARLSGRAYTALGETFEITRPIK